MASGSVGIVWEDGQFGSLTHSHLGNPVCPASITSYLPRINVKACFCPERNQISFDLQACRCGARGRSGALRDGARVSPQRVCPALPGPAGGRRHGPGPDLGLPGFAVPLRGACLFSQFPKSREQSPGKQPQSSNCEMLGRRCSVLSTEKRNSQDSLIWAFMNCGMATHG